MIIPTPAALLCPSLIVGNAINTVPAMPTATPASIRRRWRTSRKGGGNDRCEQGLAPFSIPVSAEETCCSANGNMLSGKRQPQHPQPDNARPVGAHDRSSRCREQRECHEADQDSHKRDSIGTDGAHPFRDKQE